MPFGIGKSAEDKLFEEIFNLKMSSKQLNRQATKAEKEHIAEKAKVKKAIEENKVDFARVYAETAIRKRNESLRYMRLAAKLDGVADRMKSAQNVKESMKTMSKVNSALGTAMQSMNLEKIQAVMDNFERSSENLDVMTSTMDNSLNTATASTAPQDQVGALISQVAAEHQLDVTNMLSQLNDTPSGVREAAPAKVTQDNDLERRLAGLRN